MQICYALSIIEKNFLSNSMSLHFMQQVVAYAPTKAEEKALRIRAFRRPATEKAGAGENNGFSLPVHDPAAQHGHPHTEVLDRVVGDGENVI